MFYLPFFNLVFRLNSASVMPLQRPHSTTGVLLSAHLDPNPSHVSSELGERDLHGFLFRVVVTSSEKQA